MSQTTHEQCHQQLGQAGNLRAAVFGVNDGLVSNMSLILGMAGAQSGNSFIILAGVAGLLAGACSMAAGEYISVRTQRELYETQIELERKELELYPEEEIEELTLIYEARGIPAAEAKKLATLLIDNPETALNTLAREELGLNLNELGSPTGAMIFSFLSFSIGAGIPILPFLLTNKAYVLNLSIGATLCSLFVIGLLISLFTNRNALYSGLRMLLIGTVSGSITYLIGHVLGVALH